MPWYGFSLYCRELYGPIILKAKCATFFFNNLSTADMEWFPTAYFNNSLPKGTVD